MRLEYNENQEKELRITEIEAILENELYENEVEKHCLEIELQFLRKLEQIASLTDNWDGNEAKAFDKQLIARVKDLIGALDVQPEMFPLSYESIQMEYTKEGSSYLEFEVNLNDTWDVFKVNGNGEESAFSVAANAEEINKVVKSFMDCMQESDLSKLETFCEGYF